jgi:hypothetical protein
MSQKCHFAAIFGRKAENSVLVSRHATTTLHICVNAKGVGSSQVVEGELPNIGNVEWRYRCMATTHRLITNRHQLLTSLGVIDGTR